MRNPILFLLRTLWWLLLRPVEVDGLWVAAGEPEASNKVREALQLIKMHDPRRHARILKDLDRLWVTSLLGSIGRHQQSLSMCELDERFVDGASPDEIALVIVHEATHARLSRRGIGYSEDIRQRVEAACHRQEQVFLSRLPQTEKDAERLARYLEMPEIPWSDATFARIRLREAVAALRTLKVPTWLIGFLLRQLRRKRRRQRRAALTPRPGRSASDA